jgi:hypothetical protein
MAAVVLGPGAEPPEILRLVLEDVDDVLFPASPQPGAVRPLAVATKPTARLPISDPFVFRWIGRFGPALG